MITTGTDSLTHEDLRKRAVKWLTVTRRCAVVLSEMVAAVRSGEIPDAIGWHSGSSILIECKVSRADFFRNADKGFHRAGIPKMGNRRYFMTPPKMVSCADMERFPGYGLLEVFSSGRVNVMIEAMRQTGGEGDEIAMLVSALRRVRTREFLTINILSEDSIASIITMATIVPANQNTKADGTQVVGECPCGWLVMGHEAKCPQCGRELDWRKV